jgi:glycosyltransferase involved in cell wall biosynthesis
MGDAAGLVDGLAALASDPGEWAERSERGRARAALFTWEAAARAVAGTR